MHSDRVSALIPFQAGEREDWLEQAISSLPNGMRYLVAENDGELAEAMNLGLREAESEYVLVLGADDLCGPEMVNRLAGYDADVIYPSMLHVSETLKLTGHIHLAEPYDAERLWAGNYIPGVGLLRRQAALDAGGYRAWRALEDWDLWLRLAARGASFQPVPHALYLYRQVGESRNKLSPMMAEAIADEIRCQVLAPA